MAKKPTNQDLLGALDILARFQNPVSASAKAVVTGSDLHQIASVAAHAARRIRELEKQASAT